MKLYQYAGKRKKKKVKSAVVLLIHEKTFIYSKKLVNMAKQKS